MIGNLLGKKYSLHKMTSLLSCCQFTSSGQVNVDLVKCKKKFCLLNSVKQYVYFLNLKPILWYVRVQLVLPILVSKGTANDQTDQTPLSRLIYYKRSSGIICSITSQNNQQPRLHLTHHLEHQISVTKQIQKQVQVFIL